MRDAELARRFSADDMAELEDRTHEFRKRWKEMVAAASSNEPMDVAEEQAQQLGPTARSSSSAATRPATRSVTRSQATATCAYCLLTHQVLASDVWQVAAVPSTPSSALSAVVRKGKVCISCHVDPSTTGH